MIQIVLIGSGNVAQHLIQAFASSDTVKIIQVFSRNQETLLPYIEADKITSNYQSLLPADLYIIAVTDHAIAEVYQQLPFENKLVVHTSGSVPMLLLGNKNRAGVFYPLQTFTKNKAVNFKSIPLCLEATNALDYNLIQKVAQSITELVYPVDSEKRKALHVAAVFVNNFANHLFQLGNEICHEHDVPFEILKPLIAETAAKIQTLSPIDAQTGPAKRNDTQTIEDHKVFLTQQNQKDIYQILTQSILDHGKKL